MFLCDFAKYISNISQISFAFGIPPPIAQSLYDAGQRRALDQINASIRQAGPDVVEHTTVGTTPSNDTSQSEQPPIPPTESTERLPGPSCSRMELS